MKQLNINILLSPEQTEEYENWIKEIAHAHWKEEVEFPGVKTTIDFVPGWGTTVTFSVGSQSIEFEIMNEHNKTGLIDVN